MVRFIFTAGVFALSSTVAVAYCSESTAPYCAGEYRAFDDEDDFEDCKSEMESYQSEVEDYTDCIAREARNEIDDAIAEYNDAVESFNRRARGW